MVAPANRGGRPPLYDWDDWFRRRAFVLRQGQEYDCAVSAMVQQVRNAATARGLKVSVLEEPGGEIIVAVHEGERDADGKG